MSHNSVSRFRGREADVQAAARELGVRAVLTGRLRQRDDQLLVSVELVDARDDSQLWGERYDRSMADLVRVQAEIAQEISKRLRLKLSGEEQRRLGRLHTENPEAYKCYLKGIHYWNKGTPEDLPRSREYFQQAIDLDPTYALAYVGLSDFYGASATQGRVPPNETWPKAEAAARRALEIDETLAEVHNPLAAQRLYYHRDWPGAEREFKRAIELNPNFAEAHYHYGRCLVLFGRVDEAIAEIRRALELDPLSIRYNQGLARIFYVARQYDRAIEQYRKALELDANFASLHVDLGSAYEKKENYQAAIAEWRKGMLLSGDEELAALLDRAVAESGYSGAVQAITQKRLERITEKAKRGDYVPALWFVWSHVRLGQKEQAFAWLEKAFEERNGLVLQLGVDPHFDSLRSDPRYGELLRRLGLPS